MHSMPMGSPWCRRVKVSRNGCHCSVGISRVCMNASMTKSRDYRAKGWREAEKIILGLDQVGRAGRWIIELEGRTRGSPLPGLSVDTAGIAGSFAGGVEG